MRIENLYSTYILVVYYKSIFTEKPIYQIYTLYKYDYPDNPIHIYNSIV